MKTQILKFAIIIFTTVFSFGAIAQDLNTYAITPVKDIQQLDIPNIEPVNIAEVFKPQPLFVNIKVKSADQIIVVDYKMPNDAYKSELKIQDANGRVLKTFALNNKKATKEDFYIIDLLSGIYNYIVLINGRKVEKGSFELKD